MYKKIALLSALLCTWTHYASDLKSWLEIKPSYFVFSASPMNEIYNYGGFEIQTSTSVSFYDYCDFYGSIGYRQAQGHALNSNEPTTLSVIPIDIGIKPIFKFDERLAYFVAFGPRFFYFSQQNSSPYLESMIQGGGLGLFVNTGFNVQLADCIVLGVFGEYSYEKKTITSTIANVYSNGPVQLGGFAVGLSLGYAF